MALIKCSKFQHQNFLLPANLSVCGFGSHFLQSVAAAGSCQFLSDFMVILMIIPMYKSTVVCIYDFSYICCNRVYMFSNIFVIFFTFIAVLFVVHAIPLSRTDYPILILNRICVYTKSIRDNGHLLTNMGGTACYPVILSSVISSVRFSHMCCFHPFFLLLSVHHVCLLFPFFGVLTRMVLLAP